MCMTVENVTAACKASSKDDTSTDDADGASSISFERWLGCLEKACDMDGAHEKMSISERFLHTTFLYLQSPHRSDGRRNQLIMGLPASALSHLERVLF